MVMPIAQDRNRNFHRTSRGNSSIKVWTEQRLVHDFAGRVRLFAEGEQLATSGQSSVQRMLRRDRYTHHDNVFSYTVGTDNSPVLNETTLALDTVTVADFIDDSSHVTRARCVHTRTMTGWASLGDKPKTASYSWMMSRIQPDQVRSRCAQFT